MVISESVHVKSINQMLKKCIFTYRLTSISGLVQVLVWLGVWKVSHQGLKFSNNLYRHLATSYTTRLCLNYKVIESDRVEGTLCIKVTKILRGYHKTLCTYTRFGWSQVLYADSFLPKT